LDLSGISLSLFILCLGILIRIIGNFINGLFGEALDTFGSCLTSGFLRLGSSFIGGIRCFLWLWILKLLIWLFGLNFLNFALAGGLWLHNDFNIRILAIININISN
jgi:hypothetical protein